MPTNLILLNLHDFDVILGMDRLVRCHANNACFQEKITFNLCERGVDISFKDTKKDYATHIISALKVDLLIKS